MINGPANLCGFSEDSRSLIVSNESKTITKYDFCSSYGTGSAAVAADARGRQYVLLKYLEGRGTNATTEYLAIFKIAPELFEYVRVPIASGAGPTSRWEYAYSIDTPPKGGLRIVFKQRIVQQAPKLDQPISVPTEKLRVLLVDVPGS
ncbi:MAG: hypothetical protein HYY47_02390 [Deltaproteobacteria bacterium]|nr:hypothetical protein [Deltaproteobacteria bacterium]